MKKDILGDTLKSFEKEITGIRVQVPCVARLDGKGFHNFTKGLKRPFDERLSLLMIDTAKYLLDKTGADIAYTQSDEISLAWTGTTLYFEGKVYKMLSDMSAMASVFFTKELAHRIPEKNEARFDARVFNLPDLSTVAYYFLWREKDARKNAFTMAASEYYSHKFLLNKNSDEKRNLLKDKGIKWEDYPEFFRKGTYIKKVTEFKTFSKEIIDKLPINHQARSNPDMKFSRSVIKTISFPDFISLSDIPNYISK